MSEYDPTTDNDDIPSLRKAANKSKELERQNQELARTNAFLRAGIDVDDVRMRYFVSGYTGDLDPSAIRKEAVEAGFLARPAQQEPPVDPEVQQAEDRIAAAGASAAPLGSATPEQQLEYAMAEGGVQAMLAKASELGIPINS